MKHLIWILGIKWKWVRRFYHRGTRGGWLWGMIQMMKDNEGTIKEQWWCVPSKDEKALQEKFMAYIDAIFKSK